MSKFYAQALAPILMGTKFIRCKIKKSTGNICMRGGTVKKGWNHLNHLQSNKNLRVDHVCFSTLLAFFLLTWERWWKAAHTERTLKLVHSSRSRKTYWLKVDMKVDVKTDMCAQVFTILCCKFSWQNVGAHKQHSNSAVFQCVNVLFTHLRTSLPRYIYENNIVAMIRKIGTVMLGVVSAFMLLYQY